MPNLEPATDSATELHKLVGDDSTATFEDDANFVASNPTANASTDNVNVQAANDDVDEDEDIAKEDDDDDEEEDDDDEEDDEDYDDDEDDDDEDDVVDDDDDDEDDDDMDTDQVADSVNR